MIVGEVTAFREAVVPLEVRGEDSRSALLDAVLDTGFTGDLTLPQATITALGLPYYTTIETMLGDGSIVLTDVYEATVLWEDNERIIEAHEAETDPLVGMSLLYGFHLGIDVVDGGRVTIEALL